MDENVLQDGGFDDARAAATSYELHPLAEPVPEELVAPVGGERPWIADQHDTPRSRAHRPSARS